MIFEQRTASVHPALLSIIAIIGGLFFKVFTSAMEDPIAYRVVVAAVFFVFMALACLWLWSIYALASFQLGEAEKWNVAYLATPFLLATSKLLFGDEVDSGEGVLGILLRFAGGALFLSCVWKAAEAFEIALGGKGVSVGRIAGTAAFLFFSFVGAWTLRERILTLVARSAATIQEA